MILFIIPKIEGILIKPTNITLDIKLVEKYLKVLPLALAGIYKFQTIVNDKNQSGAPNSILK